MTPVGFEPAFPASEKPKTLALDRSATGIGLHFKKHLYTYLWKFRGTNVLPNRLSKTDTPNSVGGTGLGSESKSRMF